MLVLGGWPATSRRDGRPGAHVSATCDDYAKRGRRATSLTPGGWSAVVSPVIAVVNTPSAIGDWL
jgi:hypothetical protein